MEEETHLLFGPTNEKDLKRQHPELLNVEEFKKLSVGELLFVWWYSNPTSPLVRNDNLSEKHRSAEAYLKAFKSSPDEQRKIDYASLNFPDRVKMAIDRMMKYAPGVRIRSKLMIEEILTNFEKMVKVNMDEFVTIDDDGNKVINWTGRNSYINSASKISETLPQLIKQVEEGFGVTESKGSESGTKAIHRFHSTNTD